MGNHQRCWIWGRHAIIETLRSGRWPIRELHISDQLSARDTQEVETLAGRAGVLVHRESSQRVGQLCGAGDHQGYAAQMPPFPYSRFDISKLQSTDSAANHVILVLDRIQDPFNLGAIIRSGEFLGFRRFVVGEKSQAEVNSQVVRSSSGAINHVDIARTADLAEAVSRCRDAGFQVVGTDQHAAGPIWSADLSSRLVVVIGSEGAGMSPELREQCDGFLAIPKRGRLESLNAAVAAGIVLYEISRQQQTGR